jgi:hypothetical protein
MTGIIYSRRLLNPVADEEENMKDVILVILNNKDGHWPVKSQFLTL